MSPPSTRSAAGITAKSSTSCPTAPSSSWSRASKDWSTSARCRWTKRINHPNELVSIGDQIEVQVLNINKDKQEISLGIKQVQPNPWDKVAERYPTDTQVEGIVRNLTNYGAFIEIEEGIDGLLHVSDMSWVRKVGHPSDVLNKGDKVKCIVLSVDQEKRRIALGLKQMANDPWEGDIPARYHPGDSSSRER